ncbi:MAG: hypothetical protein PHR81_00600 [Bacteroidales bacterium]|jgi:hypothetical protein|nr:hypothetical protein [Bacteroidales bacterium]MDD4213287.1 hypothetical protein [Bacteroidales bacterium]
MKSKLMKCIVPVSFGLILAVISISGFLTSCVDIDNCTDPDYPYWCSSAKHCCGYEYTDGHGTCYNTLDGCRASGYACEHCWVE